MNFPAELVEGHPNWSIVYTRTQGLDDDTYWVLDSAGAFGLDDGNIIGIGDTRDQAIEAAEAETGELPHG